MNTINFSSVQNWLQFYSPRQIAAWQLPAAKQMVPRDGIFRDLYLNWNQLPTTDSNGERIPVWYICCDVLEINEAIELSESAIVFARRIEVDSQASLVVDRLNENSSELMIVAQQIVDKNTGLDTTLKVIALSEQEKVGMFRPPEGLSVGGFLWEANAPQPVDLPIRELDKAHFFEAEPLRLALRTQFQTATLVSTDERSLSIAQLNWVAQLAQVSPETFDLAGQASALAMSLMSIESAEKENALLVPQLDADVYADKAEACMDMLRDRQRKLELYRDKIERNELWTNAASDAMAQQQNQIGLAVKLEKQAQQTRDQVLNARDIAAGQVVLEKALVGEKKFLFDAGIKKWKRDATIKASVDLVVGVGKILSAIPTIVAAGPQMAVMPAVESASGFLELAGNTANKVLSSRKKSDSNDIEMDELNSDGTRKTPKEVLKEKEKVDAQTKKERSDAQISLKKGLATAGEGGKQVADAAMRIAAIAEQAEQMENSSNVILKEIGGTVSKSFSDFSVRGLDIATGGSQEWELLRNAIEDLFESNSVLTEIDGGSAYRVEFRNLMVFGKALSEARLALAKANAELAEMKMRRVTVEKDQAIIERRLKKLAIKKQEDHTISQLIFGRVIDAKRAIYLAMEAYQRAFEYFTLADSEQNLALPKISASVDEFAASVSEISGRELKLRALSRSRNRPQTMASTVFELNDPLLLEQLKQTGFVTWELSTEDKAFNGFGRVRFNRVRVFVDGLESDGNIEVRIATSGVYSDKVPESGRRTNKRFVSQATRRNFVYQTRGGDTKIVFDGDIAPRYQNDFFNPSPFTVWTMEVGRQDKKKLNLSSVERLRLEFQGEATSI